MLHTESGRVKDVLNKQQINFSGNEYGVTW